LFIGRRRVGIGIIDMRAYDIPGCVLEENTSFTREKGMEHVFRAIFLRPRYSILVYF
jgi:hypothetical protein